MSLRLSIINFATVVAVACLLLVQSTYAMDFPETEQEIVRSLRKQAPSAQQQGTFRGLTRSWNRGISGVAEDAQPNKVGALVLFDYDSASIRPESDALLGEFAKAFIGGLQGERFLIIGHTDSTGSDAYNQALSQRRAKTVLRRLVDLGVEPGRLEARGAGEAQPLADNATDNGRALNRRVEFVRQ